ncbi:MAG TPA: SNF2-related protein, partial [Nitrosomonas sp.]|nr:SNF2-related protein [Nitrosomonas sp.]
MDKNVNVLFQKLTICLVVFLEKVLPPISSDWWNQTVLNNLSPQQRRNLEQRKISTLSALDLAALLRVFDQTWYQLSTALNLTPEARHFVKEMQTIRNKWAHATAEGFSNEDIYRDMDTMQRFCTVIGADESLLLELRETKKNLLATEVPASQQIAVTELKQPAVVKEIVTEFEMGQIVTVISDPTLKGVVTMVLPSAPENRFKVFIGGEVQTFYASQLRSEKQEEEKLELMPVEQFHSYLTALQIRYPGLSTLYSLNAARVDFIPYQFRPVLRFVKSDRPRLLIADGVGVGKTIEAGLILRELQARRDIRSVLIICPRPLITEHKWRNEMKRFEERFTHLDSATLRYCINEMDLEGDWPDQHQKVIVPYSLFDETLLYGTVPGGKKKRQKGLLDLDPPPRFDLVIVDEAHHIRNQDTFSHKAVRFFCDNAEAVVFLTATPIQLGSHDLFVLLNTLRPDLIIDQQSFEHMAEPNPYINQAVSLVRSQEPEWPLRAMKLLDQAAETSWG